MSDWKLSNNIVANEGAGTAGAAYSGSQLGTPDYAIKFKGCTGCYAEINPNGGNKAVAMAYLYNPNNASYSVGIAPGWVGFSVSGSLRAYSSNQIDVITY